MSPVWVWLIVRFQPLGQPEVGDLGRAVTGQEHVGRLEVAVDDPGLMRGVNGPGQGRHQLGGRHARLGCAVQSGVEVASVEKLQRYERQAVHFADVVDLHDVRVPELGDRLGLDPEAGQMLRRRLAPANDHLERDQAVQPRLSGLVDDAHPAAAERSQDLVAGDLGYVGPRSRRAHDG